MPEFNNVPEIEKLDKRPDVPKVFQDALKPGPIQPRTGFGTEVIGTNPNKKEGFIAKVKNFGRRFFRPYDSNSKPPDGFPHNTF